MAVKRSGIGRWWLAAWVAVLAGCGGGGDSKNPPTGVAATAGDGSVVVGFNAEPGVNYWLFAAADASLSTTNWTSLPQSRVIVDAAPPVSVCGLVNGQTYYFTINGRTGSAGGGPGSPLVSATPRAAGSAWTAGTALAGALNGVGYATLTTCLSNPQQTATGIFAAVGPAALIHTSGDGRAWTARSAPAGFTTDLNDVAAVTARVNNVADPQLRFAAVGDGGASLYSVDGITWNVGAAFDAAKPALRAVLGTGVQFLAVGDQGTIQSSTDGIAWAAATSNTTATLRGAVFGNARYVVVGDGGTIAVSTDSALTWTAQTVAGVGNLHAVAYGNNFNSINNNGAPFINTFVAVGDAGVAAVSTDNGATWTAVPISAGAALTGIAYTTQFTAVAATGAAFTSTNGQAWSTAVVTGAGNLRDITTNGFGFVAVGAGGANAVAF